MTSLNILCSEPHNLKKTLKKFGKKNVRNFFVFHEKFSKIFYGPSMPKIFHGPCKNPTALSSTYLTYSPLLQILLYRLISLYSCLLTNFIRSFKQSCSSNVFYINFSCRLLPKANYFQLKNLLGLAKHLQSKWFTLIVLKTRFGVLDSKNNFMPQLVKIMF